MGKARILIAEDEAVIAMGIENVLTRLGFEVVGVASSGEEALSMAETHRPDLVLMDILFRVGMDGIQAATEIKKRLDIPVIYLTANADQATVERARHSEPFGYLNKPINEQDLYSNIDTALYKHAMEKRLIESRERYRSLIEEINDVVFATDGDGLIIYMSPPITPVMGYDPGELLGRPFHNFIHPDDLETIAGEFNDLKKGLMKPAEYRIIAKSGEPVWIRSSSRPLIVHGTFQGIRGIITDITEQKRAEELQKLQRDLAIALGTVKDLGDALAMVLDAAMKIEYADSGGIYLTDQGTGALDLVAHRGLSEVFVKSVAQFGPDTTQGLIAESGKPLHGNYPALLPAAVSANQSEGIQAISAVPISHENKNIALLVLASHTIPEFPSRTRNAIETIAAQTGSVLANLRVDKALAEKTEELERFFSLGLDLLCIADTDGNFRRLNRSWETTLGYTMEEMEGRRFFDFIHPDDVAATAEAVEKLTAQQTVIDFVNRYRRNDGTYRWIEWRSIPSGNLIYAAARDITERKEFQDTLQSKEERLRFLLDNMVDVIIQVDKDRKIAYITPSVKRVLGYDPEEIIGLPAVDFVHPDETPVFMSELEKAANDRSDSAILVYRLRHADGRYLWLESMIKLFYDAKGRYVGAVVSSRDITDRRRLENELMQFIKIIETTSDFISTSTMDRNITFINRPGKHLLGWDDGETVIGKKIDDLHPAWVMKVIETEGITAAVRDGIWSGETALLHADGSEIPVSQIIMAHRAQKGGVEFLSTIMRDITGLKKTELEMKNSLKEKEVLLKEIHHRVKNNFQLIMSLLGLQSDRSKNENVRRELDDSCGRIRAMAHMHENLYQAQDLTRIDLASYLGKIARDLHDAGAGVMRGIELTFDAEDISLGISQSLPCGLIVNELISNSLRHAFPKNFSGEKKIHLGVKKEGDTIEIVVGDTGAGMAGLKTITEAESLGLTLVRILTEQLGGSMHFISDNGTRFTLRFTVSD